MWFLPRLRRLAIGGAASLLWHVRHSEEARYPAHQKQFRLIPRGVLSRGSAGDSGSCVEGENLLCASSQVLDQPRRGRATPLLKPNGQAHIPGHSASLSERRVPLWRHLPPSTVVCRCGRFKLTYYQETRWKRRTLLGSGGMGCKMPTPLYRINRRYRDIGCG